MLTMGKVKTKICHKCKVGNVFQNFYTNLYQMII